MPIEPAGEGDFVVAAGDTMVSIAEDSGHFADTLWNLPENASLKEARKSPEVLLPGDRVTVPPIRPKTLPRVAGAKYVFRRKGVPVKFTIVLQDEEGSVFADKKYELVIDGNTYSGSSDAGGKIERYIAPGSRRGELKVWLNEPGQPNPWIHEVDLGTLYPVDHVIGVQQRLANLGIYGGELDGELGPLTTAAIAAFQVEHQLEPTGEIDDALKSKLEEVHQV